MVAGSVVVMPVRLMAEKPVDIPKFMTTDIGSCGITLCPMFPVGPMALASSFHTGLLPTVQVTLPEAPGI